MHAHAVGGTGRTFHCAGQASVDGRCCAEAAPGSRTSCGSTTTAGGGYGWTSCRFGLACDNLVSAEVVLADGRVVRVSEREHAELFWGIRGGGGNFGIVTEFEFRLHPLGPTVLAGLVMLPIERAPEALRRWRDRADAAPDELQGRPVLYAGDLERGRALMAPLRELRPAVDHIAPMPYIAFQATRATRSA